MVKKQIIHDTGIYYYSIKEYKEYSFNGLYLYKKKYLNLYFFKIPYYIQLTENSGTSSGVYFIHNKDNKESYLDNIKNKISKAIDKHIEGSDIYPDWDGLLIKDKSILREKLIDSINNDD